MTWNLFLTAFLVPLCSAITAGIVLAYMSYQFRRRDKKEEEITKFREKYEQEKEKNSQEWRDTHGEVLCSVKQRLDTFVAVLDRKVDKEDCDRLMERHRNSNV